MNRSRRARWIAAPVFLVLVALIAVLATSESGDQRTAFSPLIDRPAPAIVGETLEGDPFDLTDLREGYVLVNFFATWCVPCIREHPELVNFARRHGVAGDATVVSVVYDSRPAQVREFFDDNGGDWPIVSDPDGRIALEYGVSGVPESYVIAPGGIVVAKLIGGVTASGLDQILARVQGADS